ncbi:penicillin-binding protein 2 [Methylophilaceae bacterium]|nr:penicillin-binding protein 2 [Methylophilaceae bacterium]
MINTRKKQTEFFELSKIRRRFVLLILLSMFLALFSRAIYVQGIQKDFYQKEARDRSDRTVKLHAYRGKIIDRNNNVFAVSTPIEEIIVNPSVLVITVKQKNKLARLLSLSRRDLEKRLQKKKEFVYLNRQLSPKKAAQVMALKIPGISSKKKYKRFYPAKEIAAHLVGFTGIDGEGLEGIEYFSNKLLAGEPGKKRILKDISGRIVDKIQDVKIPRDGQDIQLSIDKRLQYTAYRALEKAVEKHAAISGSAILLDAKTGEILAMTNYPSYNPNTKEKSKSNNFIRNRVVTDSFEPGSTIKPISVSAALESKSIKPNSIIDTSANYYKVGKSRITDTHKYGKISVTEVIQKSSNIGAILIGEKVSHKYLWNTLNNFGIGKKTGVSFPGEVGGKLKHYKNWRRTDHESATFGYGISTSLIQLAHSYTVFANEGKIKQISLLKKEDPSIGQRVISIKTSNQMLNMLESVVKDGTAEYAEVNGYRVAGKTGTSRKLGPDGKYGQKHIGSFVGIAPVSNPKFVIAVMIDEPSIGGYYGGTVAGPVFSTLMTEALKIYSIPQDGFVEADEQKRETKPDSII